MNPEAVWVMGGRQTGQAEVSCGHQGRAGISLPPGGPREPASPGQGLGTPSSDCVPQMDGATGP